jgi:hypothetical protein
MVGDSENKGLKNPSKIYPNPLQKWKKPTQTRKKHNPWMD